MNISHHSPEWLSTHTRGRKAVTVTIGIDIGGTKVNAVLSDGNGAIRHRMWQRHTACDYATTLATIDVAVSGCLHAAAKRSLHVAGIGVAIAAWLDPDRARVLEAANLGFSKQPLRADLRSRYGLPVSLVNDADAAAVAEARFGAAAHEPLLVLLTLGTGVGGGVVLDGQLVTGASGLAAELGHVNVTDDATQCACGATGCLELVASGPAVARRGRELAATGGAPLLREIAGDIPQSVTSNDVVTAALAGDAGAHGLLTETGRHVGIALATIASVLDPSLVLLAGGLATAAGDIILDAARGALAARLSLSNLRTPLPIQLATFGTDGGALGAAALVHDQTRQNLIL